MLDYNQQFTLKTDKGQVQVPLILHFYKDLNGFSGMGKIEKSGKILNENQTVKFNSINELLQHLSGIRAMGFSVCEVKQLGGCDEIILKTEINKYFGNPVKELKQDANLKIVTDLLEEKEKNEGIIRTLTERLTELEKLVSKPTIETRADLETKLKSLDIPFAAKDSDEVLKQKLATATNK